MSKYQTEAIPKLQAVVICARSARIRLLIEMELSGKMYVYCDRHEKRTVTRLIREQKIRNKIQWHAGQYDIRFPEADPSFKLLGFDKGKKVHQLMRQRALKYDDSHGRKCFFFDLSDFQIDRLKGIVKQDFNVIQEMAEKLVPGITVNYDKDNLLFYGR